jgi:hypothetical protein
VAPHGGVGVGVNVFVGVGVNVFVGVFVAVHGTPPTRHGVCVGVGVNVFVGVFVGVAVHGTPPTRHGVLVAVGVFDGVGVSVGVAVGAGPTLIAPPDTLSTEIAADCTVSSVTSDSPIELDPCANALKRNRASVPWPLAPGGDGPNVMHVMRTSPGVPPSITGQLTGRPVLPSTNPWTSASNAAWLAKTKDRTAGSNVIVNSNAPRFVTPCTLTSSTATEPWPTVCTAGITQTATPGGAPHGGDGVPAGVGVSTACAPAVSVNEVE